MPLSLTAKQEMSILQQGLADLTIQSELRKSSRMPLPEANLMSTFAMIMSSIMMKIKNSHAEQNRDVIAFHGTPDVVICKVWELITGNNKHMSVSKKEHLLWVLRFLKNRPNFRVMCKTMKQAGKKSPTEKNFAKMGVSFR